MPLRIVRNDIAKMRVDAIVNTANPRSSIGDGVDRAIHLAAGAELLQSRQRLSAIATGEAALTPAFKLPAKYVIHTVCPVWRDGKHGEILLLIDCYLRSLRIAAEQGCVSVAFPLISVGTYGCPPEIALDIATRAIRGFLDTHDMEVFLVVCDNQSFRIADALFDNVQSYIDRMYLEKLPDSGQSRDALSRRRLEAEEPTEVSLYSPEEAGSILESPSCEAPSEYAADGSEDDELADEARADWSPRPLLSSCCSPSSSTASRRAPSRTRALATLLDATDATFSEALLQLIDAKGRTDPEVYKRANLDRKHFSKIRKNQAYQPSKSTALALAIALELSLEETKSLIARAGYALTHSSKADIIVEYFISRGEYDIYTINETLFAFHQPSLGC